MGWPTRKGASAVPGAKGPFVLGALMTAFAMLALGMAGCRFEKELPFETIERTYSGIQGLYGGHEAKLAVLAGPADIDALDNEVSQQAQSLLHYLDWDTRFVIIAFQGLKNSSGYAVTIERILQRGKRILIYADFEVPAVDRKDIARSPVHVVSVRKNERLVNQTMRLTLIVDNTVVAEKRHFIPERSGPTLTPPGPSPIPSPTPTPRPRPTAYPVPVQTIPALIPRSTYAYPSPAAE
mgnify:CR=1 FL=1